MIWRSLFPVVCFFLKRLKCLSQIKRLLTRIQSNYNKCFESSSEEHPHVRLWVYVKIFACAAVRVLHMHKTDVIKQWPASDQWGSRMHEINQFQSLGASLLFVKLMQSCCIEVIYCSVLHENVTSPEASLYWSTGIWTQSCKDYSQPTNILVDCTETSLTVNVSQSVTNISRASSSSLPTHLDGMQCALQVVTR